MARAASPCGGWRGLGRLPYPVASTGYGLDWKFDTRTAQVKWTKCLVYGEPISQAKIRRLCLIDKRATEANKSVFDRK